MPRCDSFEDLSESTNDRLIDAESTGFRARLLALSGWVAAITLVWTVLLPGYATTTRMRDRLDWLEEKQIDPSAMYYTDLEAMDRILRKRQLQKRRMQTGRGLRS